MAHGLAVVPMLVLDRPALRRRQNRRPTDRKSDLPWPSLREYPGRSFVLSMSLAWFCVAPCAYTMMDIMGVARL